jgi:hypothetical protein
MAKWLSFVVFVLFFANTLVAEDQTRRIWPEEYLKPPAKAQRPPQIALNKASSSYKVATPKVVLENVAADTVVGVTIWRLRPAGASDNAAPIESENAKWIPERVEGNAPLTKGDRVRLSVEVAREGYLYVINREQYRDGSVGEPYLIFPTLRLAKGYNRTAVGKVVEIPSQSDNPPYFTLTPGRDDQVAEVISVFVTPEPINYLNITKEPLKMSAEQVAQWEKSWGKNVGRLEMVDGAGKPWTQAEKEAGMGTRLLRHEDPPPQTVFYNPDTKQGDPAFINIDLRYQQ